MLFTKPTLTHGYLDKIYDIGVEMVDILGEEQVYEIMDTITITDTEVYEGLNNIILNDEELSNRLGPLLYLLRVIICYSLLAIFIPVWLLFELCCVIFDLLVILGFDNLALLFADIVGDPLYRLAFILVTLIIVLCFEPVPPSN
jgi:hypothetical protein